ncbi:hypothetical protein [Rossellomorea marisflavi]|uniref:hypothetical protein n=1 Tax=Rossellomorea marisflavi TaxID=189381 RepID=UPI00064FFF4F|nr:hypothetical protein [Rossellomorea marisflavi]KMK93728.1 hypothetical protein VL03_12725 [Rossellomorea marisflavi]
MERITVIFCEEKDEVGAITEQAWLFGGSREDVLLSDYEGMTYFRIVKDGERQLDGYHLRDYHAIELPGSVPSEAVADLSLLDYVRLIAVQ